MCVLAFNMGEDSPFCLYDVLYDRHLILSCVTEPAWPLIKTYMDNYLGSQPFDINHGTSVYIVKRFWEHGVEQRKIIRSWTVHITGFAFKEDAKPSEVKCLTRYRPIEVLAHENASFSKPPPPKA